MRRFWHKLTVLVLAVGLTLGGGLLPSNAENKTSAQMSSHEVHTVQHYADLAIEAGDDDCPHHGLGTTLHSDDDGLCKKCCASCFNASLIPNAPATMTQAVVMREMFFPHTKSLVGRSVPTEPDIPKPL